MLLYISDYLIEFDSSFAIFQYLTLRAILAALTALLLSFMVGPMMIRKLANIKLSRLFAVMVLKVIWLKLEPQLWVEL